MTNPAWFRPRGYKHLDAPVGLAFASRAERPAFVASHSFLPLLHYTKRVKRYRHFKNKAEFKVRPIMYASHRDACIYSRYSAALTDLLEQRYTETDLSGCVIAYRKLGRANYDFASEVHAFARIAAPCFFLGLDVSDFFGTLDHRLLKARLKRILGCKELPNDWYCIFRQLTRYSWIELSALKENELFAERLAHHSRAPVATINEVLRAGIAIKSNSKQVGIPQGTPIIPALGSIDSSGSGRFPNRPV